MNTFAVVVLCLQACLVQDVFGQCTSRAAMAADPGLLAPAGLATPYGLGASYGLAAGAMAAPYSLATPSFATPYEMAAPCTWAAPAMDFTPTSGGGLPVSSASAIAPVGLSVTSENVYEGILTAAGELPFVGTVAVEGVLPTAGAGAVNHACGNGINAMVSETTAFAPGYGPGYAGAYEYSPAAAIAPAASIAPGFAAPALGYRAGWAGRGCGCAL